MRARCSRSIGQGDSTRRYRRGRSSGTGSGAARRLELAGLVDHTRPVDADEADIVAVSAVLARDEGNPAPARAPIGRHLPVGASLQVGQVGDDAAGIIPGQSLAGAKKHRAGVRRAAEARQQQSERHAEGETPTHCPSPRPISAAQA